MHQSSMFILGDPSVSVKPEVLGNSSILDLVGGIRSRKVFYRKKHCGSSWCPKCYKIGTFKKIKGRLEKFKWENTRQVVLTIDRGRFKDGRGAWEEVSERKSIANMIWNLRRVRKVKVIRWLWVLEWHRDGFPHWHLLIETQNKGMIGGDLLREYWGMGIWIKESYFKSKEHWNNVVGYFQKKGYFEKGKKYQSELPGWARNTNIRIRRYSGSVEEDEGKFYSIEKPKREDKGMKSEKKEQEIYEVRFQECGAYTVVSIDSPFMGMGYMVSIPFKEFDRFFKGTYEPGMGFMVLMNDREVECLMELCEKHQKVKGQIDLRNEGKGGEKDEDTDRGRP